jgi:hypothetical protein
MQEFKIPAKGLAELRRKGIIQSWPLLLIAGAGGMYISSSNDTGEDIMSMLLLMCMVVLILGFSLYVGIKKQRKLLESYTLIFENNRIIRQQLNTPTIAIDFSDIAQIAKNTNGTFTIKSKNPRDIIGVPAQIENYNELEHLLNDIMLITERRETFIEKYKIIISIISLAAVVTVYVVKNNFIVVAAAIFSVGILVSSLVAIQINKSIDSKTKRNSWIMLIVIASIIGRVIMQLFSKE